MDNLYLSVIVPVYNEEGAVAGLYQEILDVCQKINKPFEIIFVNDGSSDRTLDVLKSLSPIKIINLRANFGQTAAMDAGIKAASGFYLATLDGDGQNDPAEIPKLIEKLEMDDLDVVSGWRKNRKDTFMKKFSSKCAAFIRKLLINDGIHDSGCSLKVYKSECFKGVTLYGEMHRFIPAILKIKGFKIGEMVVNHRPRTTGKTKYNWKRGIKGILDMFSVWFWKKYANRPLHLFGGLGILLIFISFISGLLAVCKKIFLDQDLSDTALTELSMFGFFTGIMFFIFGLLADILSKNYFAIHNEEAYSIKEVIEK
ncbi:MAG: glycosyltransferase family 2 protein [Bacteroidales bacterium]|jgi:glycosyltransferase involved in cell wall biosynthesis|nr:glycosyltransferase family 2 protein [Bacteroidales bacterium]